MVSTTKVCKCGQNTEWCLLRRFVDVVRTYFLLIVSRNPFQQGKILQQGLFELTSGF